MTGRAMKMFIILNVVCIMNVAMTTGFVFNPYRRYAYYDYDVEPDSSIPSELLTPSDGEVILALKKQLLQLSPWSLKRRRMNFRID
ncbi:hypothetical protein QR680_015915 [Steinernema hermaphroditum]|uniref:Uncharacterized protein n=1 Tax=Steinernema hermaphroditum TaxID=289476 RepID=A0AA39HAG0_9BILA|nr:hypothetical protein QR680_015915 [Steinernema hermaphroditum]